MASKARVLENLESGLENLQGSAVLLDRLIRQIENPRALSSLRAILVDLMGHWDTLGMHLDLLTRPRDERRRSTRIRTLGELVLTDPEALRTFGGRCIDWSSEGLCAAVDVRLAPGAQYRLSFRVLGSTNPMQVSGRVRWCRRRLDRVSYRVGFEFLV